MHTVAENYRAYNLVPPQAITGDTTFTAIDVEDCEGDAMVVLLTGAIGGTTETHDVTLEASTDGGSNYSTVVTFTQFTGSGGDNKVAAAKVDLTNVTHVRLVDNMSSTSSSLLAATLIAQAILGGASVNSVTPA